MKQAQIIRLVKAEVLGNPESIMDFIDGLMLSMNGLSEELADRDPRISRNLLRSAGVMDEARKKISRLIDFPT